MESNRNQIISAHSHTYGQPSHVKAKPQFCQKCVFANTQSQKRKGTISQYCISVVRAEWPKMSTHLTKKRPLTRGVFKCITLAKASGACKGAYKSKGRSLLAVNDHLEIWPQGLVAARIAMPQWSLKKFALVR